MNPPDVGADHLPDTGPARIPVRSHRQAMDWSLVLVSQGIESVIESGEQGWGLAVEPAYYDAALQAIELFEAENRGWPWQSQVFKPGILFDFGSMAWALTLSVFFYLQSFFQLEPAGILDSAAVVHGQWWRLFTATWLHGDLGHLATNATIGVLLQGLAMGRFGTGAALLAAYLAGVGGNVASLLTSLGPHRALGASGVVMGALGLLAIPGLAASRRSGVNRKVLLGSLCGAVMLFALLGLSPGSDVMAHLGGFLSGLVLGTVLEVTHTRTKQARVDIATGLVYVILVITPWWLALAHGR